MNAGPPSHDRKLAAPRRFHGFALVPALFLIVVLGVLAVAAIRIGIGQQQTVIMSLQEARALAAAQAGIEWGAYQSIGAGGGACVPSTTLTLTEATLNGFTVIVTCTATVFANGAAPSTSFVLTSSAMSGTYGQPGYVHRVVSGTYTNAT